MTSYPHSPARRQNTHSALYKMPSPTVHCDETWKDRYRLHCKQQFKRSRDKIVNKMRQLSFDENNPPATPPSARDIVESEWIKMFGALPSSSMDIDRLTNIDDAEFEANWAIMDEIRRELEQVPPDEQPIDYIPSIDEFNQTRCPLCSNDSLFQLTSQHPIGCRQCSFQYQFKTDGSLNEIHRYHRQTMIDCQENTLLSTLWNNGDGIKPSLLFVCSKSCSVICT